MDGIRPHRGPHGGAINPVSRGPGASAMVPGGFAPGPFPGHPAPAAPDLAAVKTPTHYLAAARRRFWLILAVAVPMSILASIHALRQPKIYQAKAEIKVEAPHYDHALSTLVSHSASQGDARSQEKYAPNLVARLQSRGLAEMVVANARLAPDLAQMDDPAESLIVSKVGVRQVGKTEWYNVTLDGRDPALTKRLLEALLDELKNSANKESRDKVRGTVEYAQQNLDQLKRELAQQSKTMFEMLHTIGSIGPGGRSILEEQYANLGQSLAQKQARLVELDQKLMIAQYFDRSALDGLQPQNQNRAGEERLASLMAEKRMWVKQLEALKGKVRNFNSDPAAREFASRLDDVMTEIEMLQELRQAPPEKLTMAADPNQMLLERQMAEIDDDKAQLQDLLGRIQQAMPQQQKFLELMQDRQQTSAKIAKMEQDIASFEILARSQNEPVYAPANIVEPTSPIKPNRMILIMMGLAVSFGLGFALVFALEHLDHSVRVPEHVSHGLTLPLLGVVPRIVRTAQIYRGGHLLTTAAPDSLAADAFRNIRASLLGVADQVGPIVSLLVTSAKAGDGKSTAALNLAATCARAGERTLLLDVDLRRPSLGDVFPEDESDDGEDEASGLGLVDVLKGAIPWQRALRRTELHNLDFIATGDPTGVPIEILGTLELRQLLSALTHHYDRVILDGPAVLGMADCRVLGRMVDSSLLVVRAGAHQTVTLQRAKAVLQQSRVEIAGVIVNSLREGLKNWSSYGYSAPVAALQPRESRAALTAAKG